MTRYTSLGYPKYCNPTPFTGTPLLPKKSELNQHIIEDQSSLSSSSHLVSSTLNQNQNQNQNQKNVHDKKKKKKTKERKDLKQKISTKPIISENTKCGKKVKGQKLSKSKTFPLKNTSSHTASASLIETEPISTNSVCRYCGSQSHPSRKCKPNLDQDLLTSAGTLLPETSADDDGMHLILKKIEMDRMKKNQPEKSYYSKNTVSKKVVFF